MATPRPEIALPGVSGELAREIDERITEFEREHEPDVARGGPGWVPRIQGVDYAVAVAVNALIALWLLIALIGG